MTSSSGRAIPMEVLLPLNSQLNSDDSTFPDKDRRSVGGCPIGLKNRRERDKFPAMVKLGDLREIFAARAASIGGGVVGQNVMGAE